MHRNREAVGVLLLVLSLCPHRVLAQTQPRDPRTPDERLYYFHVRLAEILKKDPSTLAPVLAPPEIARRRNELADVLATPYAFVYYALPPTTIADSFKDFLQTVEKTRVDKQLGAAPSAGGATSAAARTGVAEVFAFALESGAISQTIDQNVTTLRANTDGLKRFLSNQEVFSACADSDPGCPRPGPLKDLELSAAFNVSDAGTKTLSGTTPGSGGSVDFSTLPNRHQFASATARYAIPKMNNRDLRSPKYREKWMDWFQKNFEAFRTAGADLLASVTPALDKIKRTAANGRPTSEVGGDDQYTLWLDDTKAKLAAVPATERDWQKVLQQQLDTLLVKMRALDPELDTKLTDLGKAYVRYLALRRDLSAMLIVDRALTLEFTYAEPMLQPKLFSTRLAFAYSPKGTPGAANPGTIALNFALDYYKDPQPTGTLQNTSRWRDAQIAVQFDRPLGLDDSAAQLSVGAYYQFQIHRGIIDIPAGATMLPGTNIPIPPNGSPLLAAPGHIYAAQAVLTVRLTGSGIKVPIGISWSNRTELVTGNEVRGHVGFTFDTSPLFLIPGLR